MKRLCLLLLILGAVVSAFAQNTNTCQTGWVVDPTNGLKPFGLGGYYVVNPGYQSFALKVTISGLPDPTDNSRASDPVLIDYPSAVFSGYSWSEGCVSGMVSPDGDGTLNVTWPSLTPGAKGGYYAFTLWQLDPTTNLQWVAEGEMFAWCRYGVWLTSPPQQTPSWATGYQGGTWDGSQGNVIGQVLGVTVQQAGQAVPNGVTVSLVRNSDGSVTQAKTAMGQVIWNPVSPGAYVLKISGTLTNNGVTTTYSGGINVSMSSVDQDIVLNCDANGVVTGSSVNGATQSSSAGDNVNQNSWWQALGTSLFVPQQSSLDNLKAQVNQISAWGPFGFISAVHDQLAITSNVPDPYWENGPSINFPDMQPCDSSDPSTCTGYLIPASAESRSRADADLSVQWRDNTVWQTIRGILGSVVYVLFAGGLLRWLKLRFQV